MLLAARVLAWHESQIRHQRRRRGEPPEVMQLREHQHRRQRVDAAETAQPSDRFPIGLGLRDLGQPRVQLQQPCLGVIDRQQIIVNDRAVRGMRPCQCADPGSVRACPIASRVVQATPQQQLVAQPMAAPLQILSGVIPRPRQIAHRLVFGCGRLDRGQQSRAPELHQFPGIAAIRLHALTRLPRNQRRRNHVTAHTRGRHLPWQRVAAGARFIEDTDRAWCLALDLPDQPTHRIRLLASCHLTGVFSRPISIATNRFFLCASMPTYVVTFFMTGSLRCGSGADRRQPAILGGSVHRVECCEHYNATMESRSFHIV
jgi:hypothetical protein